MRDSLKATAFHTGMIQKRKRFQRIHFRLSGRFRTGLCGHLYDTQNGICWISQGYSGPWDIIQGSGDVFVYPVTNSPYFHNTFFRVTHGLMYSLHYPLLVLTLFGCFMAWFPQAKLNLTQVSLLTARFCSLLLIYYTLIHMIGAPFPRYSVPLRPFLYGMALFTPYILIRSIQKNRAPLTLFEQTK